MWSSMSWRRTRSGSAVGRGAASQAVPSLALICDIEDLGPAIPKSLAWRVTPVAGQATDALFGVEAPGRTFQGRSHNAKPWRCGNALRVSALERPEANNPSHRTAL